MTRIICAIVIGIAYGLMIAALALIMGGLGHGWVAASFCCWVVFITPWAAVAWAKKSTGFLWLALLLLVSMDVWIWVETCKEGVPYAEKAISSMPLAFIPWLALWLGLHVLLGSRIPQRRLP